ncbi:MAG: glycoside hydrolase domain-containing protein, partial [Bacteroidales bacterium]
MRRLTCALAAAMIIAAFGVVVLGGQAVPYTAAAWQPETLGNYRAVVRVAAPSDAVRVLLEWRRRDGDPDRKNIIVTDSVGTRVTNLVRLGITRETGDLVFEPAAGAGDYYIYYLPMTGEGRANYPKVSYPPFQETADATWLARVLGPDFKVPISLSTPPPSTERGRPWEKLPQARLIEFQSNGEFDSLAPMEIIATAAETSRLVAAHPQPFLLFPEDREYPIRMTDDLPRRWIESGPGRAFQGKAQRGEFYAFQVGVFAPKQAIEVTKVTLGGFEKINGRSFRCINLEGTNSEGVAFTRPVTVPAGKVQALWCGLQVPEDGQPGTYAGQVTVAAKGVPAQSISFALALDNALIRDAGDDEPSRLSRLRWLDSTLAMDDEVVKPYTPIAASGNTLSVLGRKIVLGSDGLPDRIESYFATEMTRLSAAPRQVLASPLAFTVLDAD